MPLCVEIKLFCIVSVQVTSLAVFAVVSHNAVLFSAFLLSMQTEIPSCALLLQVYSLPASETASICTDSVALASCSDTSFSHSIRELPNKIISQSRSGSSAIFVNAFGVRTISTSSVDVSVRATLLTFASAGSPVIDTSDALSAVI